MYRREFHGEKKPVPYVTRWRSEKRTGKVLPFQTRWGTVFRLQERDLRGEGEPDWAHVHSGRAFHCARLGICQVCGKGGADVFREARNEHNRMPMTAGKPFLTTELPGHFRCMALALKRCPELGSYDRFWKAERGPIHGGLFGPVNEDRAMLYQLSVQMPPSGYVLKQPYFVITPQVRVNPEQIAKP